VAYSIPSASVHRRTEEQVIAFAIMYVECELDFWEALFTTVQAFHHGSSTDKSSGAAYHCLYRRLLQPFSANVVVNNVTPPSTTASSTTDR
jgi:hypothetical protein